MPDLVWAAGEGIVVDRGAYVHVGLATYSTGPGPSGKNRAAPEPAAAKPLPSVGRLDFFLEPHVKCEYVCLQLSMYAVEHVCSQTFS